MTGPNILFLISHDSGRYLGCYGKQVETPVLDALAGQGVRFDHYFSPAPQCSPSRGSILTGLYPHRHGLMGLAHLGFSMHESVSTLPMELQKRGYETALIGFSHETIGEKDSRAFSSTYKLGYEHVLSVAGDRGPDVAEMTVQYLREKSEAATGKPFFASVGFFETHRDFDEYEAIADSPGEVVPPDYLPDTPSIRKDFSLFQGSLKVLDQSIGHILNELERLGLANETLVIYTTDHGIAFPRAKGTLFDAGLETALIMSYPGRIPGGRVINQLLCNVDLMPTLLDFIGADIPPGLDGRSFLGILEEGKDDQVRDHFFAELTWHDQYHPMRGVRTERFKYIRNFEDGPSVYLPLDIHRSPSGEIVREQYYVPNVPEELYDVAEDPLEQRNLACEPACATVLKDLRDRVEERMRTTGDPLWKGKIDGVIAPDWQEQWDNGTAYRYKGKD